MLRRIVKILAAVIALCPLLASCMKWADGVDETIEQKGRGLFILNEGNFQYGNATLSYYDPTTGEVGNEMFYRANGMKLGDVAQSMTMYGGRGWIVVNNSHVIFAIDPDTFRETGRIENLPSPRYIHFVDERKAYVTQLWSNRILIVDPRHYEVTGWIEVPGMAAESGSTECMVEYGKYVYCSCWSYQNRIIKIDSETDQIVGSLEVGIQPSSLVIDRFGKLWTITDGGYEGSPYGNEQPTLCRIDAATFTLERRFRFKKGATPRSLVLNGSRDRLLWLNGGVWTMDADSRQLPVDPLIPERGTRYYGLTVDPTEGDIYVADAIDYQQRGVIYRFDASGMPVDEFEVGVTPGAYCWKNQ